MAWTARVKLPSRALSIPNELANFLKPALKGLLGSRDILQDELEAIKTQLKEWKITLNKKKITGTNIHVKTYNLASDNDELPLDK